MTRNPSVHSGDIPPPAYHEIDQHSHGNHDEEPEPDWDVEVEGVRIFRDRDQQGGILYPAPARLPPIPLRPLQRQPVPRQFTRAARPQSGPRPAASGRAPKAPPVAPPTPKAGHNAKGFLTWSKRKLNDNRDRLLHLALNIPFICLFIIHTVGTYMLPKSSHFRRVVIRSHGITVSYIMAGWITATINVLWWFSNFFNNQPRKVASGELYKKMSPSVQSLIRLGHKLLVIAATLGVLIWPMIDVWGLRKSPPLEYPCEEQGFKSSILLDVRVPGNSLSGSENSITIKSGSDTFGLKMPAFGMWTEPKEFRLTPSSQTEPSDLFSRVAKYEVTIYLAENSYRFRYGLSGFQSGTFSDDPSSILSFPMLSPPMYSTNKGNWSHTNTRPWVELANIDGTVLKTMPNESGDKEDKMMRMCGAWTVAEMVRDRNKMEEMLVGLARMMIELTKWGFDYKTADYKRAEFDFADFDFAGLNFADLDFTGLDFADLDFAGLYFVGLGFQL